MMVPRILIVDDDQNFAHMTKTVLVQKGHEVAISHSFGKALEEVKRKKPDLILMDILMPGISGSEAVRNFRMNPNFKNIPIIFVTGLISGEEEDLEKTGLNIDGIVYQILGKPCDIDKLLILVGKTLVKS